jgi:hypothetical protein
MSSASGVRRPEEAARVGGSLRAHTVDNAVRKTPMRPRPPPVRPRVRAVRTAWMNESDMDFWDLVASIFWSMILSTWIGLLITIFVDIFRDHELSG